MSGPLSEPRLRVRTEVDLEHGYMHVFALEAGHELLDVETITLPDYYVGSPNAVLRMKDGGDLPVLVERKGPQ